nr:hypothetical protein [uncultured Deefgea sp.]
MRTKRGALALSVRRIAGEGVAGGLLVDLAEAKVIRANGFQWDQWFLVAGHQGERGIRLA